MRKQPLNLTFYFDVIYRYRSLACGITAVGTVLALSCLVLLPNQYTSTIVLGVTPSRLPVQFMTSNAMDPQVDFRSRADRLQRTVLSPSRLEQLALSFGLYPSLHGSRRLDLGQRLAYHIVVTVNSDDDWNKARWGTLTLALKYVNPKIARILTTAIGNQMIAQDQQESQKAADTALQFVKAELVLSKKRLDAKSQEIEAFKNQLRGSLPEDLEVNLKILASLQSEADTTADSLSNLEQHRMEVQRSLAESTNQDVTVPSPGGSANWANPQAALSGLNAQLAMLRTQYSDNYPDIVRLKHEIKALEVSIKQSPSAQPTIASPLEQELTNQDQAISGSEQRLRQRLAALHVQINDYQQAIQATPIHQEQLNTLSRDYDDLAKQYHDLLGKQMALDIYSNLVKRGETDSLQVLQAATAPTQPVAPPKVVAAISGLVLSIAAALAAPFGVWFLNDSFQDVDDCEEVNPSIVATIADLEISARYSTVHLVQLATICAVCILAGGSLILLCARHLL